MNSTDDFEDEALIWTRFEASKTVCTLTHYSENLPPANMLITSEVNTKLLREDCRILTKEPGLNLRQNPQKKQRFRLLIIGRKSKNDCANPQSFLFCQAVTPELHSVRLHSCFFDLFFSTDSHIPVI